MQGKEVCPYCGLEQRSYTPIPRCLIVGTRLADCYVLGKVLGEGSFGITYIGWDSLLEIPVAIKGYYPSDLVSRDVVRGNDNSVYLFSGIEKEEYDSRLERFLKEARNLTRFNQLPSIVSVRDFFYANNTAYIVMDYIEGESLKAYIKREGAMDAREVLKVFRPILESLEKMHVTGIIHRDISPDNLLFDADHNLVLIDFGAAELQNAELTRTVTITFKRGFSPEEQYRSHGKQGPWTDIYALCASMYYAH
ncbi:MAG: serine/threonine protein kinase [Clostridiales bacterium]|nr:serine/threonine protein kinase [Clostridiales bacterium]